MTVTFVNYPKRFDGRGTFDLMVTVKVIVGATPSSRRGRRSHETAFHFPG